MAPRSRPRLDRHLVLTGPMASGKTTLGRLLARRLDCPFVDSDEQLGRRHGLTAREMAAGEGVGALHAAEVEALIRALGSESPTVIAAAAAVADSDGALSALRESEAMLVLLEGPTTVLLDRLRRSEGHRRPISAAEFETRTAQRRAALLALEPIMVIDTSLLDPEESAARIFDAIGVEIE